MAIQKTVSPEEWFLDDVKDHIGHRFHNYDLGEFAVRSVSVVPSMDPLLPLPKAIKVVGAKGRRGVKPGDLEMPVEEVIFSPTEQHERVDPPWVLYLSAKKNTGAQDAVLVTKGAAFFIELTDHPTGHGV